MEADMGETNCGSMFSSKLSEGGRQPPLRNANNSYRLKREI